MFLWKQWRKSLKEEVFDSSGDRIDCNIQAVDVNILILIKFLEKEVDMGPIARHTVQSLSDKTFHINELNTAWEEDWDGVVITGPAIRRINKLFIFSQQVMAITWSY